MNIFRVRCDECGLELPIEDWKKLPRRFRCYTPVYLPLGDGWRDFCCEKCSNEFNKKFE